jgi:hypothetical protein
LQVHSIDELTLKLTRRTSSRTENPR